MIDEVLPKLAQIGGMPTEIARDVMGPLHRHCDGKACGVALE